MRVARRLHNGSQTIPHFAFVFDTLLCNALALTLPRVPSHSAARPLLSCVWVTECALLIYHGCVLVTLFSAAISHIHASTLCSMRAKQPLPVVLHDSYASELDNWPADRSPVVSAAELEETLARVPQRVKDDIQFQHDRVVEFAMEQRKSLHEFEVHTIAASCCLLLHVFTPADNTNTPLLQVELFPGVKTGQRVIPVQSAGCYVPGGRFSHVSSAIMSVATAKVTTASSFLASPNCASPSSAGYSTRWRVSRMWCAAALHLQAPTTSTQRRCMRHTLLEQTAS